MPRTTTFTVDNAPPPAVITVADQTQAEADQILADARADAARIIQAANRELEKAKTERCSAFPPFVLPLGVPIRYDAYHRRWLIQFSVTSTLKTIEYQERIATISGARPFTVALWLPLASDFSYSISELRTVDPFSLPHVDTGSACLALGDAPKKIDTERHYRQLTSSLERALSGIKLDDLYDRQISRWPPRLRAAIPPEVRAVVRMRRTNLFRIPAMAELFKPIGDDPTWTTHGNVL